jgi:NADPH2:quinone reductase
MSKMQAAADLTTALACGAITTAIGEPMQLDEIADAHDRVDPGLANAS